MQRWRVVLVSDAGRARTMTRRTDPLRFRRRLAREAAWWRQPGAWMYRPPGFGRRYRLARGVAYRCTAHAAAKYRMCVELRIVAL